MSISCATPPLPRKLNLIDGPRTRTWRSRSGRQSEGTIVAGILVVCRPECGWCQEDEPLRHHFAEG